MLAGATITDEARAAAERLLRENPLSVEAERGYGQARGLSAITLIATIATLKPAA